MIKAFSLIALLVWPMSSTMHPFHISVTEVVHKPKEKVVQVSVRLFLDDFEETLQGFSDNDTLDIVKAEKSYLDEQVRRYLAKNLRMTGKRPLELQYLGFEYDRDVMWCYLEGIKVKSFDNLQVTNTLMTEVFPDQENLVHIRREGKVKSLRLTGSKSTDEVNWGT